METKQCCGNCKWRKHEIITDGFVCVNSDSDYVTEWTDDDHVCDAWESKEK